METADRLRIVTLSENTAATSGLLGEWGLAMYVETGALRVLFDTGATVSCVHNADALGVDLTAVDCLVLSHGHHDHTGGLPAVLARIRRSVPVVAHPDVWIERYYRPVDGPARYAGMRFNRLALEGAGARFEHSREPVTLGPGVMTSGEVPMVTDFESVDERLVLNTGAPCRPDPIRDDQALFVNTAEGLVVLAGCAHRGIVNTIRHARSVTGVERVHAVLGGCHLFTAPEHQIEATISEFRHLDVQRIGVSHCTGLPAAGRMAAAFGRRFFFNNAGVVTHVPSGKA